METVVVVSFIENRISEIVRVRTSHLWHSHQRDHFMDRKKWRASGQYRWSTWSLNKKFVHYEQNDKNFFEYCIDVMKSYRKKLCVCLRKFIYG